MKYFRVIFLSFFLCTITVFSQDNTTKHTIIKGETISSIAKKHNVSIADIYKLNPEAKKTLHLNQVLLIPNSASPKSTIAEKVVSDQITEINHEVLSKETLYGIAKQFKTTTDLLYKANPKLETDGLKIGQIIIVPSGLSKNEIASLSNSKVKEITKITEPLTHEVKAKESLYSIAKQYEITLKELQNVNSDIGKKGLSIGQVIAIPSNAKLVNNVAAVIDNGQQKIIEIPVAKSNPIVVVKEEESIQKDIPVAESKLPVVTTEQALSNKEILVAENMPTVPAVNEMVTKEINSDSEVQKNRISHVVLTKETKYGIAKKYGITVADLEKQNPSIQQRLDVGAKLTIEGSNVEIENLMLDQKALVMAQVEKQKDTARVVVPAVNEDLIAQLIQSASDKIGTRYRSGGTTTAGFDCSGLMYSTFGTFDIQLPRSSIEQSSVGDKIDDESAQKGDLIFFRTNGRSRINHVGMVVDVIGDEIKFIHSSTHSGVIISSTKEPYYQRTFAQVNRVLK
jgi:cell wall-associated NlpC family hydrolase